MICSKQGLCKHARNLHFEVWNNLFMNPGFVYVFANWLVYTCVVTDVCCVAQGLQRGGSWTLVCSRQPAGLVIQQHLLPMPSYSPPLVIIRNLRNAPLYIHIFLPFILWFSCFYLKCPGVCNNENWKGTRHFKGSKNRPILCKWRTWAITSWIFRWYLHSEGSIAVGYMYCTDVLLSKISGRRMDINLFPIVLPVWPLQV